MSLLQHVNIYIYISIPTTQPYFCPCWIISSVQQMREEIPHWGALRSAINFYPRKNMCINESDRLDPGKLSFWTQFMEVLEDDFSFLNRWFFRFDFNFPGCRWMPTCQSPKCRWFFSSKTLLPFLHFKTQFLQNLLLRTHRVPLAVAASK